MCARRTFVTFDTSLPDDSELSESGDIEVPAGFNVCVHLKDILENIGLEVSTPLQHQFYGWELTGKRDGRTCWFLLQYPGPWLLTSQEIGSIDNRFEQSPAALDVALTELNFKLTQRETFSNISWLTKAEYESGMKIGHPAP